MALFTNTKAPQYAGAAGLMGDADRIRTTVLGRFSPFDGIGEDLRSVTGYDEALEVSGLGFEPRIELMQTIADRQLINGYKAIFNEKDLLSVVKNEYTVVSNREAFAVSEDLKDFENFTYEVSNMVNYGAKSRLFMSGPIVLIEGEEFTPYAVFHNSFDLSKSVSIQIMFLRMASKSGFMRRGPGVKSSVTFAHFGAKEPKLEKLNQFKYSFAVTLGFLQKEAAELRAMPLTRDQFVDDIIPLAVSHAFQRPKDEPITDRQQNRVISFVETILSAYDSPDLSNFDGTAYKAVLAMADIDSHAAPFVNRGNADLYINRILQDNGLRPSLANTVANHFKSSK